MYALYTSVRVHQYDQYHKVDSQFKLEWMSECL